MAYCTTNQILCYYKIYKNFNIHVFAYNEFEHDMNTWHRLQQSVVGEACLGMLQVRIANCAVDVWPDSAFLRRG